MEYKGYIIEEDINGRYDVKHAKRGLIANTPDEDGAKELVDRFAANDEAHAGLKEFTVCAAASARVYCTILAKDMDDAINRIRQGECDNADWDNEEWVERPEVVNVTDDETGELRDYMG